MAALGIAPAREMERLDNEIVEAKLIDTLFGNIKSILLASFLGVASAVFVAWSIDAIWMLVIALLLIIAAAWRCVVHIGYQRDPSRATNALAWERHFAWAAWGYSALLGITGAAGLLGTDDLYVHMLLCITIVGFVSMMASRNAGRPNIVSPQINLILFPMGCAFALMGHYAYYIMAFICFGHSLSTIELARSWKDKFHASFMNEIRTKRLADVVHEKNELFNTALDNMKRGFAIMDDKGGFIETNARIFELMGVSRETMPDPFAIAEIAAMSHASGIIDKPTLNHIVETFDPATSDERVIQIETTNSLVLELHREVANDGRSVFSIEDITLEWAAAKEIERRATRDELTGLWNRTYTLDHLKSEFARLLYEGKGGSVLFLDLDGFKSVNDIYGHSRGDVLLKKVAEILQSSLRSVDHVGRMGGDEFLLFIPDIVDDAEIRSIAERIILRLCEPVNIEQWKVRIGATIGIARLDADYQEVKDVVRNADMALYANKNKGERNTVSFFTREMQQNVNMKNDLESQLRATLDRGGDQFAVYYQPIFETRTKMVIGCEALIRWNHPVIKTSPAEFIPIAEETSLIVDIGEWVLRTACREAASWENKLMISINLSPVQFLIGDIVATVKDVLDESGLEPSRLELEFTETVMAREKDKVSSIILQLKALGIRIALDDFGTGYSSISYLRDFHFDKIKIDRSFVMDVDTNLMSEALVKLVVGVAKVGNQTVVAEGIETEEHLKIVKDLGVQQGQGYLLDRPLPVEEFRRKHVDRPQVRLRRVV